MGYIYAFASPSMPGLAKIGATERDPADRLAEANAQHSHATWTPAGALQYRVCVCGPR